MKEDHRSYTQLLELRKESLKKTFKHACSLNLYMNRYLKIQEKIDLESQEQTFIIIPTRLLK